MSWLLITTTVLSSLMVRDAETWGVNVKYAVNCPDRCNPSVCGAPSCSRTVLDDCGCCMVCAAGRGEHCYRTVSGMHGVKCGPGFFCEFYKDEDDYGDEYGVCKADTEEIDAMANKKLAEDIEEIKKALGFMSQEITQVATEQRGLKELLEEIKQLKKEAQELMT
uniref:IGFBP N-terminal domain-containing protein n=1 Tax=Knipowitschia caucasica TaxID=637954 RepID=A0AAV2IR30_KNICA